MTEQLQALSYAHEEALKQHGAGCLTVQEDRFVMVWHLKDTIAHSSSAGGFQGYTWWHKFVAFNMANSTTANLTRISDKSKSNANESPRIQSQKEKFCLVQYEPTQ